MTTAASGVSSHYRPQLDALRAIAVFLVMVHHFAPESGFYKYFPDGAFGVRLFFVLSGYLITGILLRARDSLDAGRSTIGEVARVFYIRRALRLLPLYYGVLLALAVVGHGLKYWPWQVFYANNLCVAYRGQWCNLVPFWSLAVEEQFYFVWPWVVLLTPRRYFIPIVLSCLAVGPLSRYLVMAIDGNMLRAQVTLVGCLDSLAAGALIAFLARDKRTRPYLASSAFTAIGVGGMIGAIAIHNYLGQGTVYVASLDILMAAFSAWAVYRASVGFTGIAGRLLTLEPLRYLGRISYGIYVLHQFAPSLRRVWHFGWLVDAGWRVQFVVYVAASIASAALSWQVLEGPINRLKQRIGGASPPVATS